MYLHVLGVREGCFFKMASEQDGVGAGERGLGEDASPWVLMPTVPQTA